jgi:molybdenum cofactor cytidylyltransferase
MGKPKALLRVDGQTFIERIVEAFGKTRVGKTVVVLGHHLEEIRKEILRLPVEIIVNADYKKGQLSSLQAAIRRIDAEGAEAMLVHLVDLPFVNPELVDRMIEMFRTSGKSIVAPRYRGRRGHPVLFSSRLFGELLSLPVDRAAKEVVRAHQEDTLEVETDEEGVIHDIDTPEEYSRYVEGK